MSNMRGKFRGWLDRVLKHEEPELPSDCDTITETIKGSTGDLLDATKGSPARIIDKSISPTSDIIEAISDIAMHPLSNLNIFNGRLIGNLMRATTTAPSKIVTETVAGAPRGIDDIVHRGIVRPTHRWRNKFKYLGGTIVSWATKTTQTLITKPFRKITDFAAKILGKPDDWTESFQKWSRV